MLLESPNKVCNFRDGLLLKRQSASQIKNAGVFLQKASNFNDFSVFEGLECRAPGRSGRVGGLNDRSVNGWISTLVNSCSHFAKCRITAHASEESALLMLVV
jgi:hypothetical protein